MADIRLCAASPPHLAAPRACALSHATAEAVAAPQGWVTYRGSLAKRDVGRISAPRITVRGRSEYEVQAVAGSGEIKTCLLSARVFGDTIEGSLVDITERKRAERELAQRVAELQRFNRLSVGRELRIIDLKRQVNQSSHELGREPP